MSEEKIRHIIEVFENDYCEKCSEFNCLEGSMEEIITAMKQLQQQNQKYKEVIDNTLSILRNELYKSRCRCDACNDYFIENLIKLLEQKEVE